MTEHPFLLIDCVRCVAHGGSACTNFPVQGNAKIAHDIASTLRL